MIEHGIPRFAVTQEIHQRHAVSLRAGQRPHDKFEIRGCETLPTIRTNHRNRIMSIACATGKLADEGDCILVRRSAGSYARRLMKTSLRLVFLVACLFALSPRSARANGGAWQTGVPSTGNA